jgi:hypothetical protein
MHWPITGNFSRKFKLVGQVGSSARLKKTRSTLIMSGVSLRGHLAAYIIEATQASVASGRRFFKKCYTQISGASIQRCTASKKYHGRL